MLQLVHVVGPVSRVDQVTQLEPFLLEMRDDGWVKVVRVAGQHEPRFRRVPTEMDGTAAASHPPPDVLFDLAYIDIAGPRGVNVDPGEATHVNADHGWYECVCVNYDGRGSRDVNLLDSG